MAALKALVARWRSDSGAEFVEFALAFPLLLLIVMGIIDFGMMFQQYEVITNAAREGARVMMLPNYSAGDAVTRAQQYVNNALISGGGTATYPTPTTGSVAVGANCIATVTVFVNYPHQYFFLSGIGHYFGGSFGTKILSASATMRSEGAAGACP